MFDRTRFLSHVDEAAAVASLFDGTTPPVEAGAEPAPEPAPAAAEPAAVPAEPSSEPAAPAWADDPAFHAAVAARATEAAQAELAALIQSYQEQATPQPAAEPDLSQLDLTDPEHLAWFLNYQREQTRADIRAEMEPVLARNQAEAAAEEDQRLQDAFADAIAREHVEWVAPESAYAAKQLAGVLFAGEQAKFPARSVQTDRRAAQTAIDKGVKLIAGIERAAYEKGKAAYGNEMGTIAAAGREPAPGAGGVETLSDAPDEIEAARRFMGERTTV